MSIASDDLRLFGLDLRNLWHDLRSPWAKLVRTPAWSWLAPHVEIQVKAADASVSLWEPDAATHGFRLKSGEAAREQGKRPSVAHAVLLPEALLLRKRLNMPRLDTDKMHQALALEAINSNPFGSSDMVWGHAMDPKAATPAADLVAVDLVLASRKRVEQFLATQPGAGETEAPPEVWAPAPHRQDAAMLVPGFGEGARARLARRYWMVIGSLLAVAVLLCLAIAVTPYLQLRARVLQANIAYAELDRKAGPFVGTRESLLNTQEQVKALADIIGHRLDPLQVVQMLTNALSDDVVLQRLQIEGRKVMLGGQASDSASLMQKLGALPQVKEVRAPSAAVRQPGMTKETFQIEFQLTDDFGVSPSDAAAAAALAPASVASGATAPASAAAASASAPASAPAATTIGGGA